MPTAGIWNGRYYRMIYDPNDLTVLKRKTLAGLVEATASSMPAYEQE